MTAIVINRYRTNAAEIEGGTRARQRDVEAIAEIARAAGCLHHRIAVSDDDREVIMIDEWQDEEAFNRFALNPDAIEIVARFGLDEPPESHYYRTMYGVGEF
jgi:quinol monooxygenase YgiN